MFASSRAEDDFWSTPSQQRKAKASAITAFPGASWVEAGPVLYGNYSGPDEDQWTGAFLIQASFRDWSDFFQLRLDGLLGVGGPTEGLIEGQVILLDGLHFGLGAHYTDRAHLQGRLGLYVEDQNHARRRGGIYMFSKGGGGIEFSWPISKKWALHGDIGQEEDDHEDYQRAIFGALYEF
jgi:hypothetical protein